MGSPSYRIDLYIKPARRDVLQAFGDWLSQSASFLQPFAIGYFGKADETMHFVPGSVPGVVPLGPNLFQTEDFNRFGSRYVFLAESDKLLAFPRDTEEVVAYLKMNTTGNLSDCDFMCACRANVVLGDNGVISPQWPVAEVLGKCKFPAEILDATFAMIIEPYEEIYVSLSGQSFVWAPMSPETDADGRFLRKAPAERELADVNSQLLVQNIHGLATSLAVAPVKWGIFVDCSGPWILGSVVDRMTEAFGPGVFHVG